LEDPSNYTDIPIYPNWPKFFPIIYLEKDILDNEGLLMVKIYALSIVCLEAFETWLSSGLIGYGIQYLTFIKFNNILDF